MTFSRIIEIGEIIQNAITFNTKTWQNWQNNKMMTESLIESVQRFFDLLEQRRIKYVLAGGIALLYYVEGRNTQDLDLLMAAPSLEKLPELNIQNRDIYFVRARFGELPIDILLTRNLLFKQVYNKYSQLVKLLERKVSIVTVEGLLLLKLYALPSLYRQGNFARIGIYENDIATLIYYYKPDTKTLLDELANYVNKTDWLELQKIVREIQERTNRFVRKDETQEST